MLWTSDIEATIDFYANVLGFTCEVYEKEWGWASLHKDQVRVMLSLPNAHLPFEKAHFTGSIYFNVNDVDSLWQSLQGKVKIAYPIEDFDYGMREFAIYDNNGYMLQFGEEIMNDEV